MAKINIPKPPIYTHEGAKAKYINAETQLRRSIMACLLWESQFYEDGVQISKRIKNLVPQVAPTKVAGMAIEAREDMKLRHVPLLLVREMARHKTHSGLVKGTLTRIIQRADELAEFVAIYWRDGKEPLSAQIKKGLAKAFEKFDAYQLAKYDRDGAIRLRDVLFLCHAKPKDLEQEAAWKKLIAKELDPPDTWEVALSSGADKKATWCRLLYENKLGALALLRNLRNMLRAGVPEEMIKRAIQDMKVQRVLPFRFLTAAGYSPSLEPWLEKAMFKCVEDMPKLVGGTVLLVDRSASMNALLSHKSELNRYDAACGLAILIRELCSDIKIFTFNSSVKEAPLRRGFGLRDAMGEPYNGTYLGQAVRQMPPCDRLIVITDEQSHDRVPDPVGKGYMINVASYRNGVGYGPWLHIDGWSEAVLSYIQEYEKMTMDPTDDVID